MAGHQRKRARLGRGNSRRLHTSLSADAVSPSVAAASFQLREEDEEALLETSQFTCASVPEYRNRNEKMMSFFQRNYPEYYEKVVYDLTPAMKNNKARHYHKATRDFHYHLLDPKMTAAFLSSDMKWKDKEKKIQYGFSHVRKFHDAILKCSEYSGGSQLTEKYRLDMNAYIDSMRREKAHAKQNNQIEETNADPIGMPVYQMCCGWAVEEGTRRGLTVWASMVTQWNCMGRPINVDALGLHNMRKEQHDSVSLFYDKNKKDQGGQRVSLKNCYANPFKPEICFFLSMGCYLCINQDRYERSSSDKIFIKSGRDGSASDTYQKGLRDLVSAPERQRALTEHIRVDHLHAYGIRKGSATHVTTGTVEPPSVTSVILRGEWKLGGSLDVYWFFSHLGDTYLGRCLAGFDPDGEDIDTLPPHFKEGMENEHIAGAMQLSYGGILKKYPNIESVLLLFLASIVYHADTFIRPYVNANSKHPFNDIAILHRPELLNNLRELVTLEPGGSVQQATGVPRYTKILKFIRKIGEENNRGLERVERAIESIPMSVRSAIDDLAVAGGNVTAQMVYDALEQVSQNVKEVVKNEVRTEVIAAMQELRDLLPPPAATPIRAHRPQINMDLGNAGTVYPQYSYVDPHAKGVKKVGRENVYVVPSGFEFSSPSLRNAWIFWFYGKVDNQSQKSDGSLYSTPVKPYRFIEPKMLPEKLRKTFNNCWCPILDYMQRAVEADDSVTVPLPTAPSTEFINITYEMAMNVLKSEHPDLFTRSGHSSWTVATWSKELRNSKKRKHGACA